MTDVTDGELVRKVDGGKELAYQDFPTGERADKVDGAVKWVSIGCMVGRMGAVTQQRLVS